MLRLRTRSRLTAASVLIAGLIGSVLVFSLFRTSAWCSAGGTLLGVGGAQLIIGDLNNPPFRGFWLHSARGGVLWLPVIYTTSGGWTLSFPIWIVLAPFVAAPPLLWIGPFLRRRRAECPNCGYDLEGLAPGPASPPQPLRCPECGHKVRTATRLR